MIKVPNNKVISSLSIRHLKHTWIRNIFSILAVILTTLLIMTVLTIGNTLMKASRTTKMNTTGQKAEISFQYLLEDEAETVASNRLIEKCGISRIVASVHDAPWNSTPLEIRTADAEYADMMYSSPTIGRLPEKQDEVAVKSWMLNDMGIPCETGQTFPVTFDTCGRHYELELTVCGIWDDNKILFPFATAYISYELADKLLEGVDVKENIKSGNYIGSFQLNADLKGDDSDLEKNLQKIVEDTGIDAQQSLPRVNLAFRDAKTDTSSVTAVVCILIIVMISGYFLIYNIFYISVIKNIRLYGMLKTIGTTSDQIRRMVNIQAIVYCAVGIPCGLIMGYFFSDILFPKVASFASVSNDIKIQSSLLAIIISVLLSFITVFVSCRYPARRASKITPVESLRYNGINEVSHPKKSFNQDHAGIIHMGICNLFRNKKKTIITIVSVSLGMILVNVFYTFSNSFDVDNMVNSYIYGDILVADKRYLDFAVPYTVPAHTLTEKDISDISSLPGVENAAVVYFRCDDKTLINSNSEVTYSMLYGMDDYWYDIIGKSMIEGSFDKEKFDSGNYIIITYDKGADISIGDTVTANGGRNYEIMGKADYEKLFSLSARYNVIIGFSALLPESEISGLSDTDIMSISIFAKKGSLDKLEEDLQTYFSLKNSDINYVSRAEYKKEIVQNNRQFSIVGLCLSLVILFIGIINFINSSMTGILSRKYEFAVLNAIGMTSKQIKLMLVSESLIFTFGTAMFFIPLGTLFSYIIIGVILKESGSFIYHFSITPILTILLIFIIISVLLPLCFYKMISKKQIIERLRDIN